jgi:hypothetical protein
MRRIRQSTEPASGMCVARVHLQIYIPIVIGTLRVTTA